MATGLSPRPAFFVSHHKAPQGRWMTMWRLA